MSDQTFWKSVPPTLIGMGKSNKLCNLDLFIHAGNVDFCKGRYMHRYKGQGLGVSTRGNKVHKLSGGTSAHKVYKRCRQVGALYQEEHSQGCSSEELPEATEVNARAGGECDSGMFVS